MDDFLKLIQDMRQAQRDYFRSRTSENLQKSKELERRVDAEVKSLLDKQATLFEK
jgi:hypothetical protein